ncbi:MAG: fla cluster protein FlaF [Halodesulfurarchaeum sp.]
MGFSVSGSAAIVFLAVFLGFGMLATSTFAGFERVADAKAANTDGVLEVKNTDVELVRVTNTSTETVNITVSNTGATTLDVNDTDVILDGTYQVPESTNISDRRSPELWAPGESLTFNVSYSHDETVRVKIVTGPGVSVFEEVHL